MDNEGYQRDKSSQHRIHLTDKATPRRDPQRRLIPLMQEAVRAEILKLLDNRIIYPISDSQWVSLVHAVPKKAGFTVVENEQKELVLLAQGYNQPVFEF